MRNLEFSVADRKVLERYLKHDTWDKDTAAWILAGINPEMMYIDGTSMKIIRIFGGGMIDSSNREYYSEHTENILEIYTSNPNHGDMEAPEYWLKWAMEKGIEIPWLEWAESIGLVNVRQDADKETEEVSCKGRWPWGDYETKLLRTLAEAAERFWVRYDPSDNTTAPTNRQVVEWLKGRGVADRTATIMATILRADGLPTGPRK